MELSGTYRLPTEETLNKPSGFAQPQGLGYAGLSFGSPSSLSEPPSDDSQISSVIKLGLSKDAAFTKAGPNCVYCGVGLSPEVLSVEWDQRVCESCYCALTYSPLPRRNKRHGLQFTQPQSHHGGAHSHAYWQRYSPKFDQHCLGCGDIIQGSYVEALQSPWHLTCFKCAECEVQLVEATSFLFDGKILCERDYFSNLNALCSLCQEPLKEIYLSTLDGKAKYHPSHFKCYRCHLPLPQNNFTKECGHFVCLDCNRYR